MIEVKFTGHCEACPHMDLIVEKFIDSLEQGSYWKVYCDHEEACDRIEKLMEEEHTCD